MMSESANFSLETLQDVDGKNNTSNFVVSKEVKITIHVFTLVVALVGNSLLIAAFVRMKEPVMLLIANMAASDLLTAIFLLPRYITNEMVESTAWQVQGLGGTILCKMCSFLSDISLSVSTQSLMIIAMERFFAVMHPFKARSISAKVRRLLIASTWIVSTALHSPYFYIMELVKDYKHNITICKNKWEIDNKPAYLRYNIFLYVTVLFIPLVVISILYPIIVVYIRRDKMAAHRSSKGRKTGRQRSIKLFKMATATVLSLLICWTSFSVIVFLMLFAPDTLPKCNRIFEVIDYVSNVLASSYCAVNPFICFVFLRNFRGELGKICKRRKRQGSTTIDSTISGRARSSTGITDCRVEVLLMNSDRQTSSSTGVQGLITPRLNEDSSRL